jgi:hypothetical protein
VTTSAENPSSRAWTQNSRLSPSSCGTYSWYQRLTPVAATSAGVVVANVEWHMIVPASRAAFAIATSPSGCAARWYAIGATSTGSAISSPSTTTLVPGSATSRRTRGRSCQRR